MVFVLEAKGGSLGIASLSNRLSTWALQGLCLLMLQKKFCKGYIYIYIYIYIVSGLCGVWMFLLF